MTAPGGTIMYRCQRTTVNRVTGLAISVTHVGPASTSFVNIRRVMISQARILVKRAGYAMRVTSEGSVVLTHPTQQHSSIRLGEVLK